MVGALGAVAALTLASAGVILAAPGIASAVIAHANPTVSYEADCTSPLEAGIVAPYVTTLSGSTTIASGAPTGQKFGFTGTAGTTIVGAFVAGIYAHGLGTTTLGLHWNETLGSTDGRATGTYNFASPKLSQSDGGGQSFATTWTSGSTTLTGDFSGAAVGDAVFSLTAGIPGPALITAINGTASATINVATTAASSAPVPVGYGADTVFTTPISTGNVFTTNGVVGETAGVGVTSAATFAITAAITVTFGGATGQGPANCLLTGYDAAKNPGPAQGGGATPPLETAPVLPAGSTTPLVSITPLEFPAAASVSLSATAPGPPTGVTASVGAVSTTATVHFSAPADDGGAAITGYTVTADDLTTPANGGQTRTDVASPIKVKGLTAGDIYTFTVTATNANGTGPASAASNPITPGPASAPLTPTIGTATPGNASATVTWTPPASDGTSPVTGYIITPSSGAPVSVGNVTSDDVTGLINGTAYTFTVAAVNAVGTGPASAASNSVTPAAAIVPVAPTIGGYWIVTADGGVFSHGTLSTYGSLSSVVLNHPIVGAAGTPSGKGYWLVASDGGVFAYGDAGFYGSMGGTPLNQPVVGMAATPDGKGYWLVASDGGVFSFGDAAFEGSAGGTHLNQPVVGIAGDGGADGYWLVASDGGIFSYGSAAFEGSMGGTPLNQPIVGAAAAPGGGGYWLVASDGGVFSFGTAAFQGSAVGATTGATIVGIAPSSGGYVLVSSSGGVFNYGAPFDGSQSGTPLSAPVAAIAA